MATIETTKEKWCQAEVNRVAGELALSREPDAASAAEAYFERALPPRASQRRFLERWSGGRGQAPCGEKELAI
jgi:hypothetical protein